MAVDFLAISGRMQSVMRRLNRVFSVFRRGGAFGASEGAKYLRFVLRRDAAEQSRIPQDLRYYV